MKSRISILLATFCIMLFTACGKDSGGEPSIEMELIETTTEQPAKVRLFFKVDLGEEHLFETLTQTDFEIYENNSLISSLESQASIRNQSGAYLFSSVLLLDLSGSVLNSTDLPRVKDAAVNFIESVMPTSFNPEFGSKEMAVFWFDGEAEIHALTPFTINRDAIIDSIRSIDTDISSDNSTNLNGAVVQGLSALESRLTQTSQDPNLSTAGAMLIFTDGTDQAGRVTSSTAEATVRSLSSQYSVFTIGLGSEIDENTLRKFGRDGFELAVNSFDLNQAFLDIANQIKSAAGSFYVLEYCSPKRSGEHTIQIRANFDDRSGRFSTNFNATGFTGGCVIN
ncbi:MAG: VWA domain-containing protein [Balneolaceae bacterium]|nr:VWA domain-containing protein [Balneolaceae bacterium]